MPSRGRWSRMPSCTPTSHYSFLDGASSPEDLVIEAVRRRLSGIALTDHDGLYGVVRMAEAADGLGGITTVFGAELSLGLTAPQNGVPDPEGSHLLVLANGTEGYRRLAGALTDGHLAPGSEKGRPVYHLDRLAASADGHWRVLTGCRKGRVRQALEREGDDAALGEVRVLMDLFGGDNVLVELTDHGDPGDSLRNDRLAAIAARAGVPVVATNAVHYADPSRFRLAAALSAVRARRSLEDLDGWLPSSDQAHIRSGAEMARRFTRFPGAVERTVEVAQELGFQLRAASPRLPRQEVPSGHTPMSWLRELTWQGAQRAWPQLTPAHRERLEHELQVIEVKDFPGYFLIVHDIVSFAHDNGILCQGRGSAAASAVCYALGITVIDPIFYGLPFERFLSELRRRPPTSTSTSTRVGARRSSSTSTPSTAGATRRRSPTSSPTGPRMPCATWPKPWVTARASRTRGPSRSSGSVGTSTAPTTTSRRPSPSSPVRC